ncbi:MAG: rhodanese-like domain-containing protein [Opitutales bacterium]
MHSELISFSANPANRTIDVLEEVQFQCEVPEQEDPDDESEPDESEPDAEAVDPEISPELLRDLQSTGEKLQIIDVREEWESQICSLEGATLIPLGELRRGYTLPPIIDEQARTVVYCKAGVRGEEGRLLLSEKFGLSCVSNLEGGILAWAEKVDPSLRTY